MHDLLIVGAGVTSATLCAKLKHKYKILVVDTRSHLGGNCYDYKSGNTYIHKFGVHIFHSPNQPIVEFLSNYTEWLPFEYSVTGEIEFNNQIVRVPFPYCKLTEEKLGRQLNEQEVLQKFFYGYSKKMWGMDYVDLPQSIKGRVPKDTKDTPQYFPGQFQGIPKLGYTRMMENMFDGVDMMLGIGPDEWQDIPAKKIIYCGRIDLIKDIIDGRTFAEKAGIDLLPHRSLNFKWKQEEWDANTTAVNFCHDKIKYTRKVNMGYLYGDKNCGTTLYETPCDGTGELAPFYPIPTPENNLKHSKLKEIIQEKMPNLLIAGRVSRYQYLDIFQAVGGAITIADKLLYNA